MEYREELLTAWRRDQEANADMEADPVVPAGPQPWSSERVFPGWEPENLVPSSSVSTETIPVYMEPLWADGDSGDVLRRTVSDAYEGDTSLIIDPVEDEEEPQTSEDSDSDSDSELLTESQFTQLTKALEEAKETYARITAGRRGVAVSSKFSKYKLDVARRTYEVVRDRVGAEIALLYRSIGEVKLKAISMNAANSEITSLSERIQTISYENAAKKKFKRFYEWWARQDERNFVDRTVRRGLVMLPVGAAVGVVGMAGGAVFGTAAGAIVAGGAARGVIKGAIGAKIARNSKAYYRESAVEGRVGRRQREDQIRGEEHLLNQSYDKNRTISLETTLKTEDVTAAIEKATKEIVNKNRRDIGAAALLGAGVGFAGSLLSSGMNGHHAPSSRVHHKPETGSLRHPTHSVISHESHPKQGHPLNPKHSAITHPSTSTTTPPETTTTTTTQPPAQPKIPAVLSNPNSASNTITTPAIPGAIQPPSQPSAFASYSGEYPWNYFADRYGSSQASSRIIALAQKAQAANWQVNSFPHGINSIVSPSGTVYDTTPQIISALEQFDS